MPDGQKPLTLRCLPSLESISADDWDACAGTDNPFVGYAFLSALERSRSAVAEAGWEPHPLVAEDARGRVLGCVPLYAKSHSYGEYVFDWAWADAWQRAGLAYYPKLQVCVPFTPVPGPRLLLRPEAVGQGVAEALADALRQLTDQAGLSSAHVTFATEDEARLLEARGWLPRLGQQYHWHNPGYRDFDDFLSTLSSRKRKALRKERERAQGQGLEILTLGGAELRPDHWDAFYRFYRDTSGRKWGHPYLTRDFFHRLGESLADRVVMVMARQGGEWVAGALNLRGGDALFGRNWGALGEFPFLHFEMCYYRAIDYAIAHGLKRVEAGAQGEHKVARGYLPAATWSAHYIREPPLRRSVARFLEAERRQVAEEMRLLAETSPYRRDGLA